MQGVLTHVLLVNNRETVGEVEGLSLGDQGSDLGPGRRLGGIGKQVHDDGTLLDSLWDIEQGLSGNPTVLLSLLPRFSTLSDTDNDLDTLVSGVKRLTVTLRSVTDHGEGVVLEEADFISEVHGPRLGGKQGKRLTPGVCRGASRLARKRLPWIRQSRGS